MAKRWMHLDYLPSVSAGIMQVEHKLLKDIYTEWKMIEEGVTTKSSFGWHTWPATSVLIDWKKQKVHNSPISTGSLRRFVLEKAKQLNRFGCDYSTVSLCPHGCEKHRIPVKSEAPRIEIRSKQVLPLSALESGDIIQRVHPVTFEPAAPLCMGSVISKIADYQILFREWDAENHYTVDYGSHWIILTSAEYARVVEQVEESRQKAEEEANALLPLHSARRISLDF